MINLGVGAIQVVIAVLLVAVNLMAMRKDRRLTAENKTLVAINAAIKFRLVGFIESCKQQRSEIKRLEYLIIQYDEALGFRPSDMETGECDASRECNNGKS